METNYSFTAQSPLITVIALVIVIALLAACWRIYAKAGEAGWKALIPIYNVYIQYKIFWGNGLFFLLSLIPIVNIVVGVITMHKMSKAFGHGVGFTLGLIFFPYIFMLILGFGGDEYLGPQ